MESSDTVMWKVDIIADLTENQHHGITVIIFIHMLILYIYILTVLFCSLYFHCPK